MLLAPQVSPRSKTFRTILLFASVATFLLIYQSWSQHRWIVDHDITENPQALTASSPVDISAPPSEQTPSEQTPSEQTPSEQPPSEQPVPVPAPAPVPDDGIPKKIWYKLGPKGKSQEIEEWSQTCIKQNPVYRYEFLTDESADYWVEQTFSPTWPELVHIYLTLTVPILKADLLRYLLLYIEGGVWLDLDVNCEGIPIDDWIPEEHRNQTSMLLGWEFDYGWDFEYFHEVVSWTILSKPRVPHMLMVIQDIVDSMKASTAEHNVTFAGLTKDMVGDIVDYTGPRRLTRSVLKSLELTLGHPIARDTVEKITKPVRVADVTILPGYAFSNFTNHFDPANGPVGPILVTHHYAGTWKNDYGGEQADP